MFARPATLSLTLIGLLAACGPGNPMDPGSLVKQLRVLGVQADPPEIAPLETAALSALAIHTDGVELGFLWVVCEPVIEPELGGATFSACQDQDVLSGGDGIQNLFATGVARILPTDIRLPRATYTPPVDDAGDPTDILAGLAPDDPRRIKGGAVTVMLLVASLADMQAFALEPETVDIETLDVELVLKRLTVSHNPEPNANPVLTHLTYDGADYLDGDQLALPRGVEVEMSATVSESSRQSFEYRFPDGHLEMLEENLSLSWYADAGRMVDNRTQSGEDNIFTTPGGDTPPPDPADGQLTIWVVVRDDRGGQSWLVVGAQVAP